MEQLENLRYLRGVYSMYIFESWALAPATVTSSQQPYEAGMSSSVLGICLSLPRCQSRSEWDV